MARFVTHELLRECPLFAALPLPLVTEAAAASSLVVKRGGARIFEEGSAAEGCFVLASGRGKIVAATGNGGELTVAFVDPFSIVGELALIDGRPRSAGFVAVVDTRLVYIPRRAFLALRRDRAFEQALMVHVASTLRRVTEQLRAVFTFDAVERVAWCVAQVAATRGRPGAGEVQLAPKPTHRELAEMAGASRETVSRALLRLRDLGWLRWDRTCLYLDGKVAARYAGGASAGTSGDPNVGLRAV